MMHPFHDEILGLILKKSGKPTQHTFLDSYLGNDHIKYPIDNPTSRGIAKGWMRAHKEMTAADFRDLLTSLIEGESCTEKMMAGFMMEYSTRDQRNFDPVIFDQWLNHLVGWVEVDTVCTGDFLKTQLPAHWPKWKKLILKLSKDKNFNKRRASLVLFCSVLGRVEDEDMATTALKIIDRLKSEKDVLITKAISWVLRTMIKNYRKTVSVYLRENATTLPKIAVRETMVKLKTGKKK